MREESGKLQKSTNLSKLLRLLTFYDKVLIIVILLTSLVLYLILVLNINKLSDTNVVVRQDGKILLQLTAEEIKEDNIYYFEFDKGTGSIEIKDRRVRMLPMDRNICPRSICSDIGWIEGSMKAIVCLPNRLVVNYENGESGNLDGVAF